MKKGGWGGQNVSKSDGVILVCSLTNLRMELFEALNSTCREEISKIKLLKEKTTYSQNTGSWFSSLFRGHFCGLGIVETNFADNKF